MSDLIVIAEAGVNHNGDLPRALDMVSAAAEAGADYIKFQAFSTNGLVAEGARTAAYQEKNTGEEDQGELLRGLEIDLDGFSRLVAACGENAIGFLATAFDHEKVEALIGFGMDRIKVASGELTNGPALASFASFGLPVLLSTGMATMNEVRRAVETLQSNGADDITVLQCTSLYPAPPEYLNLQAMLTMKETLGLPVGFSDHSLGDHAAVAAVALGARVVEKHFTLDRSLPGPDQKASLEPNDLADFVRKLRDVQIMLGSGEKMPSVEESATASLVRRSWHAARDLPAGTVLGEQELVLKRPARGLAAWIAPVGRRLTRPVVADAPITEADLDGPLTPSGSQ